MKKWGCLLKNRSERPYLKPKSNPVLELSGKALGELVNEFMRNKKAIKFTTKGHSMAPIINQGDIVTISPYLHRSPDPGDIVAYLHPQTRGLIIHRLIKITPESFVAKGDNCRNNDNACKTEYIIGHVSQINKKDSLKNTFLHSTFKKIITCVSTVGLFYALNKCLKRI